MNRPLREDKHELIRLLRYVQEYLEDGSIGTGKQELYDYGRTKCIF